MQMGHSAGGVDSLRKASGLFNTHSRVKEVGTAVAAAAVLEAPIVVSFVAVRLALEFFFVMLVVFYTTREKNCSVECDAFERGGVKRGVSCPIFALISKWGGPTLL